jgi:glycopeptide antibiotics resistance protein
MLVHDGYLTAIPGYWAVLPALPIVFWIWRRGRSGAAGERRTWAALLAVAHVTAVVALTIFPIPIAGQDYYRQTRGLSEDNLIPFATISGQLLSPTLGHARQLLGNMIALAPLAVYGPELRPTLRDWRRFALAAIAFAAAIELAQLTGSLLEGFTYRVTDVDDALMNGAGAVTAFFLWRRASPSLEPALSAWTGRLLGRRPAA